MDKLKWLLLAGILVAAGAGLILFLSFGATDIGEIVGDPERFSGEEVVVRGVVVDSISVIGAGGFKVEDDTGSIWVLSKNVPTEGREVKVDGTVKVGARLFGEHFGVVIVD